MFYSFTYPVVTLAVLPLVVSMTFFPSATALLAASAASPAAKDTFDSSLSNASIAECLASLAGIIMRHYNENAYLW